MDLKLGSFLFRMATAFLSVGLVGFGVWWMAVTPTGQEQLPPARTPLPVWAEKGEIAQKLLSTNGTYQRLHIKAVEMAGGKAVDGEAWVEQKPKPRYRFELIPREDGASRQWGLSDGKETLYGEEALRRWTFRPVEIGKGLGPGDSHSPGKYRNGTQMPEARFLDEIIHPERLAQGEVFQGGRLEKLGSEMVAGRSALKIQLLPPPEGPRDESHRFWIDRETGMILRYVLTENGAVVYEFAVTQITLDGPSDEEKFRIPPVPQGYEVVREQ